MIKIESSSRMLRLKLGALHERAIRDENINKLITPGYHYSFDRAIACLSNCECQSVEIFVRLQLSPPGCQPHARDVVDPHFHK